ncbi:probable polyol transporter 6 [Brachypodium distachyon]|uniref:Major facilitator superfamily (MFS) profile domain-containing protein n=1 Tax=Brachypodium distachyon TaxID=15368 RepID=I1H3H1_BRADI|nr:probable polyol transporter 6 [Brachypodium distachyon]XP_024312929.1 probable polyol transporter 6 [Brachypodium distachyon]XP_024312930.1 probable polyol transporter 6 [Brachypodium distachyon]XP_024312931.1 probable polyol transporter 6 [Brachypodium distachyon]XP_024312932.1 probable polyol transporter 6 [Brachypodium distachyon]XP_024312933.1 probable polyol transporter 6 [Brachypodium distachyon]XP_024312934.1 probable polyol transporter 6 [Brachypodium distachyon]XP_024312935.1 pro|eukprot:XP_003561393.1 probable polyol transporter 6 [Brachypodium distachyon]
MGEDEEQRKNGSDVDEGRKKKNKYAVACSIIGSIISILMGYDTGVMSGAMLFIKEDLKTNDTQVQVLAGILNVCALAGSLTAGRVSDLVGRRRTISLAACIFLAGSVLMGLSPNFATLLAGRCVAGVGVGYALMIAPVYAAEIASADIRGSLTSLPEICISFGILIGYVANYFLAKLPLVYGWRTMLGLGALPSAALALGVLAMPESPRWLVMQGRADEALVVLNKVCDDGAEAEVRLTEIKAAAGGGGGGSGKGVLKELFVRPTPAVRRILVAALGVHFFQHLTGIEAVVLYSPRIFKAAGIATRNEILAATIGVGVTKTVFIMTAILLVDRVGRRPLYLSSLAGIVASLTCLGLGLTVIERAASSSSPAPAWAVALAITTVFAFVASFSVGVGPITWAYSSEVYPLRLRAQGASVGVATNRIMNAGVSMTFVTLYKAITIGGAFFLFAGLAVVAAAFFYFFCPETQGRPLEDIEEVFSTGWRARQRHHRSSSSVPDDCKGRP